MNTSTPENEDPVEAVQRLFLKHSDVLRGFITGLVVDLTLAQDVYQEVFIAVSRLALKFRPGTDFLAWARAISWRKVQEIARQRKGGPRLLDPQVLELLARSAAETTDGWSRHREALTSCLGQLQPNVRQVVELRYSEERRSTHEIALQVSRNNHAVEMTLSRARKWLRECVQKALRFNSV